MVAVDNQMLYTEADRPRGHGECGGSARNGGSGQEQNWGHIGNVDKSGPSTSRGSQGGARGRQNKTIDCLYCGRKGHKERKCWKKKADSNKTELSKAPGTDNDRTSLKVQTKKKRVRHW